MLLKGVVTPLVLYRTCHSHFQREQHCIFTWETAGKTDFGNPGFNSQLCLRRFRSHIFGESGAWLLFRPTTPSTDLVPMCNKGPKNSHGQRDPVALGLGYFSGGEDIFLGGGPRGHLRILHPSPGNRGERNPRNVPARSPLS